jgi:hypothetical protein
MEMFDRVRPARPSLALAAESVDVASSLLKSQTATSNRPTQHHQQAPNALGSAIHRPAHRYRHVL